MEARHGTTRDHRRFEIDVTDVDGGVEESVSLAAQHPSESEGTWCALSPIVCIWATAFGCPTGLCDADEPPLSSESPTGEPRRADIGSPWPIAFIKPRSATPGGVHPQAPRAADRKLNKQRIHSLTSSSSTSITPPLNNWPPAEPVQQLVMHTPR